MHGRTLDLFRKVCALMGSEHDGERAAAALKATAMLRAAGKSWADVGIGSSSAASASPADHAHASMMAAFYMTALESEQARTTHMAKEITRLKREVARLKGMWTEGPGMSVPPAINLLHKPAVAVAAAGKERGDHG